jgi:hypothetical protein
VGKIGKSNIPKTADSNVRKAYCWRMRYLETAMALLKSVMPLFANSTMGSYLIPSGLTDPEWTE